MRKAASQKKPQARRCPICSGPMPEGENRHAPFCSERCRMVDLGRWLGGDYAVPSEEAPVEELERAWRDDD